MPRFVVLIHDTPPDYQRPPHLDLMLESGSSLRTWALSRWPENGETVPSPQLADHRLDYLDYEGPISGGRGSVTRHDAGTYSIVSQTGQQLIVRLDGVKLRGELTFHGLSSEHPRWEATWLADPVNAA